MVRRKLGFSLLFVGCLFVLTWGAPRVSASVAEWMRTPPTKAKLVSVDCALQAPALPAAVPAGTGDNAGVLNGERLPNLAATPPAIPAVARVGGIVDAGFRFNMVAVLLDSAVPYDKRLTVRVRWSLDRKSWSSWRPMGFELSEGGAGACGDASATCSEPVWVGDARYVQYVVSAAAGGRRPAGVTRVRFSFINTKGDATATDSLVATLKSGVATIAGIFSTPTAYSLAERPPIVTRAQWGADESWRTGSPSYATVKMVFIHHTAGTNNYTQADSPAIVRGIYYYHTKVRGWWDIGYNFLVDKYGTIYEGRYGGVTKGVIGAHTLGFNTHSCGVALMGSYDLVRPSGAALSSLEKLLAWKLDLNHINPLGTATMLCGTTERFRVGQTVTFPVIAGHRQACYTECPGAAAFSLLPEVRAAVAQQGQPKIYGPWTSVMAFNPQGSAAQRTVTVGATLSEAAAWTVSIKDAQGSPVRTFTGQGTTISAAWDGRDETGQCVPDGVYTVVMSGTNADGTTRAASLPVTVDTVVPTVSGVGSQVVVSPNGDGIDDGAQLAYSTSEAGSARVRLYDATGTLVRVVQGWTVVSAGSHTATWDGLVKTTADLVPATNGTYTINVEVKDSAGNVGRGSGKVKVDLTLGFPQAKPLYFSPNGDGTRDQTRLTFRLTLPATVAVVVAHPAGAVRTLSVGKLSAGDEQAIWDGRSDGGQLAGSGRYTFTVTASNSLGKVQAAAAVVVDRYVPVPTVPATRTVSLGTRVKIDFTVKDPYSPSTHNRFFVRNKAGTLLTTVDVGWQTTGVAHTLSYKPSRRGKYTITLLAADKAGNVAAPQVTTVTVM